MISALTTTALSLLAGCAADLPPPPAPIEAPLATTGEAADSAAPTADTSTADTSTAVDTAPHDPSAHDADRQPVQPLRDAALPGIQNLLIISIDTLRRDDLGRYSGAADSPTPFLDALLSEGLALDNHRSTANWTYPALATALSGVDNNRAGFLPEISENSSSDDLPPIPDDLLLLADHLAAAGYVTGLSGAQKFLERSYGISPRYDHVDAEAGGTATSVRQRAAGVQDLLLADGRPWLHHVHLLDPHAPYSPPPDYVEDELAALAPVDWDLSTSSGFHTMIEEYRDLDEETRALVEDHLRVLYGGELRYLDDQIERLFSELERAGALEGTLVMLFSDHGEQFWEHGSLQHRADLYGEETLALAGFWWDGAGGRALKTPTSHVDLAPTALSLLGVGADAPFAGRFVMDVPPERARFSQNIKGTKTAHTVEVGSERLHYEWTGEVELYDLSVDPGELEDLSEERPGRVRALLGVVWPEVMALDALFEGYSPTEPI